MNNKEKLATLEALEQENRRLREELVRLDEMPRKRRPTVSDLSGVSDLNTGISKGIRSMPGAEERYYLDLYLMQKHMERMKKMTGWIKKWRLRIGRKFEDVSEEKVKKEGVALQHMAILMEEPTPGQKKGPETAASDKEPKQKKYEYKPEEWKEISLDY